MRCCCDTLSHETFGHLFFVCPIAIRLWTSYAAVAGLQGLFLNLKDTIIKWWKTQCVDKLKPLYRVVPAFILWQIWKRRNNLKHDCQMSVYCMEMEINRNIHCLAISRYPWLRNLPTTWPKIVKFFES